MHRHGPSCLPGPVSRKRRCWKKTPMDNPSAGTPPDPEIRADLVARVRREIAAGTYDTPEKWDVALERLLDRLEKDEG